MHFHTHLGETISFHLNCSFRFFMHFIWVFKSSLCRCMRLPNRLSIIMYAVWLHQKMFRKKEMKKKNKTPGHQRERNDRHLLGSNENKANKKCRAFFFFSFVCERCAIILIHFYGMFMSANLHDYNCNKQFCILCICAMDIIIIT